MPAGASSWVRCSARIAPNMSTPIWNHGVSKSIKSWRAIVDLPELDAPLSSTTWPGGLGVLIRDSVPRTLAKKPALVVSFVEKRGRSVLVSHGGGPLLHS